MGSAEIPFRGALEDIVTVMFCVVIMHAECFSMGSSGDLPFFREALGSAVLGDLDWAILQNPCEAVISPSILLVDIPAGFFRVFPAVTFPKHCSKTSTAPAILCVHNLLYDSLTQHQGSTTFFEMPPVDLSP